MVSVIGEGELWDCVSSDDHNAVFDIFTEESKLVRDRCRSGSATLKEKSSVTRFLVELGALEFTIHKAEKDGELQSSVRVSIPEKQERGSMLDVQQDESRNVVKQATGKEVTSELSAVADEHKDSDAGDSSDCGDIMDGNDDDDDDEIPVWMRDPPAVEQTKERSEDLPELPEKEMELKDRRECPKCKSLFYNPWDFDLHYLKCSEAKKPSVQYKLRTDECDLCYTVVKRTDLLFHFFKVHDLSYKEAIKKIPGFKEHSALRIEQGAKNSTTAVVRCPLCEKVARLTKTMLLHLYKFHSLSYEEALQKLQIKVRKSNKSAGTKRTESNCKRRKSQRIQTRKVLIVLRNLEKNEINEMRHISDVETGSPRLPIADSIQDHDRSEIQSETEDKDIVQIKEECHERDTTQHEEGDEQPQETFPVALAKGAASYSVKDEGPFACDICDKEFNSQSEIPNHMINVHFQCSTCLKTSSTRSNLKIHLETHKNKSKKDMHTCPVCQKTLQSKYTLAHHVKIHKKRECQFCHKKFLDSSSLGNHLKQNHKQDKLFSCDQCGKAYFKKKELQIHVKRKHGEVREKSWECDQCGKGFYNESDVTIHKRKVHIPSGQHLCELCGNAFKSKGNLAQHHLTAHTDSFKFTCHICGKNFKRSSHLNAHRKVHSNDRPFKCEVCGKGFTQKAKLKIHLDWHNDVRKFACTLCPKTFLTKGNLDKHQTVHTKMYKHSCNSCGHGFCDLSQLRLHLSRVHGIIVKSKITKGEREKNVQSKAKTPTIASAENQTNSGISAEIEPLPSTSTTENQSLSITGRIDMDEHVIDSETQVHNPAVLPATSEASCADGNLLATEVFTAMMHSHGIH